MERRENFELLAVKAKNGDTEAMGKLWAECCIIANYYLDKNNYFTIKNEDRDDVKQDLYFLIIKLLQYYDEGMGTFHGYFYQSLHYFIWDIHKKNLNKKIEEEFDIQTIADKKTNENITSIIDYSIFLDNIKKKLKPAEFNTFYLFYNDGYSVVEIAKQNGITPQAVNKQLQRAVYKVYGRKKEIRGVKKDMKKYGREYYAKNKARILFSIRYRKQQQKAKR